MAEEDYTEDSEISEKLSAKEEVVENIPAPKPAPPKKYADPVKVDDLSLAASLPSPAGPAVVSTNSQDVVRVSAIVYRNDLARKSLSVHHLQRRLVELGFTDAGRDKDGYFADHTRSALAAFQNSVGFDPDGEVSLAVLTKLFDGDPNVVVES